MSVREGSRQLIGDKHAIGRKPISSPSANPTCGQFQKIGDSISMSRKPVNSPSANPKSGQFQTIGDGVKLNRTPQEGWCSAANLPMSERAIDSSKNNAANRGKGKR